MITASVSKDHVPFGRFIYQGHPAQTARDSPAKSLSEAVENISICDPQLQGEAWMQRVTPSGDIEEIFFKHKTVVVSRVSGSENDAARVIKTYTLQTNVRMAFWCTFMLPSNELDTTTKLYKDDVQTAICIVESNMVTVRMDNGVQHNVLLPFRISGAWPMERGVLLQRSLDDKPINKDLSQIPVWFSMLHPLGDLAPVISKSGPALNYAYLLQLVYISPEAPYLAVTYDMSSRCHSMCITRRTAPEEELTYTELQSNHSGDVSKHRSLAGQQPSHLLTPSRMLSLSSILSPSASPRVSGIGSPSLKSINNTASPSLSRLNAISMNSKSLISLHHQSAAGQKSPAASPSVSSSVAHSAFVMSGHHSNPTQDVALEAAMFEPIRPDICLQHVWSDTYVSQNKASKAFITTDLCGQRHLCMLIPSTAQLRMIKLELSNSGDRSVIFGTAINISAKDACPAPSMNMMLLLDLESNLYLYTGSIQIVTLNRGGPSTEYQLYMDHEPSKQDKRDAIHVCQVHVPRLSFGLQDSLMKTPMRNEVLMSSRPASARNSAGSLSTPKLTFGANEENAWSPVQLELNDSAQFFLQQSAVSKGIGSICSVVNNTIVLHDKKDEIAHNYEMCYESVAQGASVGFVLKDGSKRDDDQSEFVNCDLQKECFTYVFGPCKHVEEKTYRQVCMLNNGTCKNGNAISHVCKILNSENTDENEKWKDETGQESFDRGDRLCLEAAVNEYAFFGVKDGRGEKDTEDESGGAFKVSACCVEDPTMDNCIPTQVTSARCDGWSNKCEGRQETENRHSILVPDCDTCQSPSA